MQAKIFEYFSKNFKEILCVENDKEANDASEVLKFLGFQTFVLPDFRAVFGDDLRSFYEELSQISAVMSKFYKSNSSRKVIISPIRTLLNKLPSKTQLKSITLNFGDKIDLNSFKDEILRFGYSVNEIVEIGGEVSFRGDIIDIFPLGSECAFRILLDNDEIESIRRFDFLTQKSDPNELESIEITPFLAGLEQNEFEDINEKIENFSGDGLINDLNSLGFWFIDGFVDYFENFSVILSEKFDKEEILTQRNLDFLDGFEILPQAKEFKILNVTASQEFFEFHKDTKTTLIARNSTLLEPFDLNKFKNIEILEKDFILNLISQNHIIISLNKPYAKKRIRKSSLAIDELRHGDFVVHEDYGIGKFVGLSLIEILGAKREFVTILYENDDKLLLPVENLNKIDRYIASGGVVSVDKLGKATFLKIKEKVREKLFVIASKIIASAAQRELIKGVNLSVKSHEDYVKFIARSGFEYTKDQNTAILDILNDLKSGKVMDRLLSGDVGFGKTEVAMNAIYACVKSGFSALFFVPTTLLSSQHFATLNERFKDFDIPVFRLDRFTSAKQKSEIMLKISKNEAFVCVGTHALLNLEPKNLGLIIIDEEHKFGVKQKEKLKEKSLNSHVLSMSATPIPRSLNMALSSLKSYSTLLTPPLDRLDVRTMVKQYDEKIIKEAILRELRRGGQIFYIHNHIATIERTKKELLNLIPNLKILVLHSKIDAKTTEDEILKFSEKKYDLMLCTSIVESGIHMPLVNTIIIESADRFGIADLHQLRGRVGRSQRQGYCYYIIDDKNALSEDALKRLVALESNSYLGSGSSLAYHDLEIRGGGNLVGEAQSGHIEAIGYSLYLKMLEDEIAKLLNHQNLQKNVELKIAVNAFLNAEFIPEDRLRLDIYRRLSKCEELSQINEIECEMQDRFGKADIYTKQFIDIMRIKVMALNLSYKSISSSGQNIVITDKNDEKIRLKSPSKDDDDVIAEILVHLRKEIKKYEL